MPRPKAHFSVLVTDHVTEKQLKVESVDLPFADGRRFRLRVKWEVGGEGAGGQQDDGAQAGPGVAGKTLEAEKWAPRSLMA